MASARKQSSVVQKQRAIDDEVKRAELIIGGLFKSIDITARDVGQLARLRPLLLQLSNTDLPETRRPAGPISPTTWGPSDNHETIYNAEKRLGEIKEAETEATQNLFDYLGTTNIYWDAHVWFVDYHLTCKACMKQTHCSYPCVDTYF